MQSYLFHVNGMHCKSCVILIESELKEAPEVRHVNASLEKLQVEVSGEFGDKDSEHIAQDLSAYLTKHGYSLSTERQAHPKARWQDFKFAAPIALAFIVVFILLQKLGIVNLVQSSDLGFGTAFVVGLIASVSTCMAVVGGLVLSMSANFAKEGDKVRPQLYFHLGRLVSFFVLGGVIGAIGASFRLGITGTFVLGLLVGLILLILGVNLLDVFPWAKKLQLTMPGFIGKRAHNVKDATHTLTPMLVGIATFFLPCGFTQSMQLYSLTTGSFVRGAFTMFAFALGTLPILSLLSFTSLGIHNKVKSGIFFKTAGLVVIFFALFNLYNSVVAIGWLPPLFNI